MHEIAICICTFERPAGLRALLGGIERQRLIQLDEQTVCVIVVDNSPAATAAEVCDAFSAGWRFRLGYLHEPRKGLAVARNAALSAALARGASLVAFIDDDEMPEPSWLERLVERITVSGAAAAVGPVYPVFQCPPPRWLPVHAYTTRQRARDGFADMGHSGNSIFDAAVLRSTGLSFDARYNESGGEDTIFFKQLRAKGLKIAWAENAVAHELVPRQRMSARWLWQRWSRTGEIEAHLGSIDPDSVKGRLVSMARGLVRVVGGSLRVLGAVATSRWRAPSSLMASTYTFCRGLGLIASAIGYRHRTYATKG
jgi:glycosyltransferase involved in cell wall biosynthesis